MCRHDDYVELKAPAQTCFSLGKLKKKKKETSLVRYDYVVTGAQAGISTPSLFELSISCLGHRPHHQKTKSMTDSLLANEMDNKGLRNATERASVMSRKHGF